MYTDIVIMILALGISASGLLGGLRNWNVLGSAEQVVETQITGVDDV